MKIREERTKEPKIDFLHFRLMAQSALGERFELTQILRVGPDRVRRCVSLIEQRRREAIGLGFHSGLQEALARALSRKTASEESARSDNARRRRCLSRIVSRSSGKRPKAIFVG